MRVCLSMARKKVRKTKTPSKEQPSASSTSSEEDTPQPKTPKAATKKKQDVVTQQQQDDVESDHSDSESEDTEDLTPSSKLARKKPDAAGTQQQQQQQQEKEAEPTESDSVSGSESEDESESEPKTTAGVVKFAPTSSSEPLVLVTVGEKRRVSDAEGNLVERGKKDAESEEKSQTEKKKPFERSWSEEDEIALLEGYCEFTQKNEIDPTKDMNAFHDFIKKSLHFDVKLGQLKFIIWRLKKKFENFAKGKKGENKAFSKPHEQKLFELSKKIWGSGSGSATVKGRKGKGMNTENEEEDKTEMAWRLGWKSFAEMANLMVKERLHVVDGEKKTEMEEKWKDLQVKDVELFLQQIELVKDIAFSYHYYAKGKLNA